MTREINIDRLHLKMPAAQSAGSARDARMLAKSVAAGLAKSLKTRKLGDAAGSLDTVSVRVPRKDANAKGVVRAIQASIRKEFATARKER